jgi:hypothetical protein
LKVFVEGDCREKPWGETVLSLGGGAELVLAFPMILEGDTEGCENVVEPGAGVGGFVPGPSPDFGVEGGPIVDIESDAPPSVVED